MSRNSLRVLTMVCATMLAASGYVRAQQPIRLSGSTCATPPVLHCPDKDCANDTVISGGPVVEPKTGRNYFLDYPCDLKKGEKVTFILSLHGGGSYGNWQRHYFPLLDYVDKYRLVVATPFSPRRAWSTEPRRAAARRSLDTDRARRPALAPTAPRAEGPEQIREQ